jgi:hypothetical protein
MKSGNEVSVEELKTMITVLCKLSSDVLVAEDFDSFTIESVDEFSTLEKTMEQFLTKSSKDIGESLASSFDNKTISAVSRFALDNFTKALTEHKFKAEACKSYKSLTLYKKVFGECKPHVLVELWAQPIVGEANLKLVVNKSNAMAYVDGEIVSYALDISDVTSDNEMLIGIFSVLKTIEQSSDNDLKLLGSEMSKSIEKFMTSLSEIPGEVIDDGVSPEDVPELVKP